MKHPLVSIIIVNWNGGDIFRDCLASLKKINYPNWELIIVDNGSHDGTQKYGNVKNKENLGFAGGNNKGLEKVKGEFVLLLNNDTKVKADFLNKMIARILEDGSIGVIQPKIKIMADPTKLDTVGSYLTYTGFLQHVGFLEKDSAIYNKERIVFSAKGACMLIRRKIIDKIGLFDDDFGSYFEETDFCWRVWNYGYKIIYFPDAEIYHKVGFTSKKQNQVDVNYNSFKNRIATIYKNLEVKNLVLIGTVHLTIIFGLSLYYLITMRFENSKMIWKSIYWNIKNSRKYLIKRRFVQSKRTVSDKEVFKYILKPFDYKRMFYHFLRSERMLEGKHAV